MLAISTDHLRTSHVGETALLCVVQAEPTLSIQRKVWALAELASGMQHVVDVVTGMGNILVIFDPTQVSGERIRRILRECWRTILPLERPGRSFQIPVVYGGEFGADLRQAAEQAGVSVDEFAHIHSEANYVAFALGSSPGFAYLSGLPSSIATPRRASPVLRAQGGGVAIGGNQTGITSSGGQTGWHVIGRSLTRVFDVNNTPPALFQPGDSVRFEIAGIEPC